MKQLLLKALLVLIGGVFMSTAAWADGEIAFTNGNRIGAADNSTEWYGQASEIIAVGPHQRLTLKFKTYTATDEELTAAGVTDPWNDQLTHALNIWDGQEQNLYMKGCGWGWKAHKDGGINDPADYNVNTEGVFNQKTYGWAADYRTMIGTGADVVMYIERNGSELSISQTFTTSGGDKYNHYFSGTFGLANSDVWLQMTVERAHIDITADKELTDISVSGKLIGLMNNTTAFWSAWSDYFTLEPNQSLTLRYKCHSNRINNYNGGVPYVTTDADREATGYTEYFGLRPDNWVNVAGVHATSTNYDAISWNWATFREKVDGSTVTLTITRSGANVAIREEFAPADGSTTLWEEYNQDCGDGTQNIRVFLTVEGAHIDLLSTNTESYQTINAYGWSTYSSDKALDFSTPIDGLTVYSVTGHSESALTLNEITTAVPANTGLLLKGTAGTCYTIPVAASGTAPAGNLLKAGTGASVAPESGKTKYALSVNGGVACFKKIAAAREIPVGKAYLEFNETIEAREFFALDESEVTGIGEVRTKISDNKGDFYNLNGQKVLNPSKGLYIVNGKKVLVP